MIERIRQVLHQVVFSIEKPYAPPAEPIVTKAPEHQVDAVLGRFLRWRV